MKVFDPRQMLTTANKNLHCLWILITHEMFIISPSQSYRSFTL